MCMCIMPDAFASLAMIKRTDITERSEYQELLCSAHMHARSLDFTLLEDYERCLWLSWYYESVHTLRSNSESWDLEFRPS
jgi:hypothetical protein